MKSDYISRQAAIETAISWYNHCFEDGESVAGLTVGLNNLPSADVVEVVRCKDCRYRYKWNEVEMCDIWENGGMKPTDFCSKGERRNDGTD